MTKSHRKTQQRLKLFQGLLSDYVPGDVIPDDKIVDVLMKLEDNNLSRWDRVISQLVTLHNESKSPLANEAEIRGGEVVIVEGDVSLYEERQKKAVLEKRKISARLLYWLFDQKKIDCRDKENLDDEANYGRIAEKTFFQNNWQHNKKIQDNLTRKRAILRNRTVLSMLVDAGTTNQQLMENFLADTKFPLKVSTDAGIRKINPSIITNSISVAHMISERRDRRSLTLTILGGVERPDRRSITGDLALSWARSIRAHGTIDLSIIGTTGIRQSSDGLMGVYMDHDVECELKGEFLQMAEFRIVICDSSKLLMGSYIHIFAAVTRANVDLIVMDDGAMLWQNKDSPFFDDEEIVKKEIKSFMTQAAEQEVGVMTVGW